MEKISDDFSEYEECLSSFYSRVHWNDDAEYCTNQLQALNYEGKMKNDCSNNEEENPYSAEPLLPLPYEKNSSVSPKAQSCITIDADLQKKILQPYWRSGSKDSRPTPISLAHEWLLFTREERLALYQYALQHTQPPPTPPELILQVGSEKEADDQEGAAFQKQQRDLKRRRQAYRTAATGRKTLTEVTREVIHNIMALMGVPTEEQMEKNTSNNINTDAAKPPDQSSSSEKNSTSTRSKERIKHHQNHSSGRSKHRRDKRSPSGSKRRHQGENRHDRYEMRNETTKETCKRSKR